MTGPAGADGGLPDAPVIVTGRLMVRRFGTADAPFMLELLNDPDFHRFIGDRGVRTVEQAVEYIEVRAIASYREHGFGPCLVALRSTGEPIGLCSLLKRPTLEDVDLGFAFLPAYRSQGYAYEASEAMMRWARDAKGLDRLVAIAAADNEASARLLDRLGFRVEPDAVVDGGSSVRLFSRSL